jgi:hypothetical protein
MTRCRPRIRATLASRLDPVGEEHQPPPAVFAPCW